MTGSRKSNSSHISELEVLGKVVWMAAIHPTPEPYFFQGLAHFPALGWQSNDHFGAFFG
jgi:hypothetical protein